MLIQNSGGIGAVRPCCDPSVSTFSAIFSDTCDYCSEETRTAQQALPTSGGVPVCDPNAPLFSNLFSNSCNVSVNDAISQAVGLPSVPAYVYWGALGLVGFLLLRR